MKIQQNLLRYPTLRWQFGHQDCHGWSIYCISSVALFASWDGKLPASGGCFRRAGFGPSFSGFSWVLSQMIYRFEGKWMNIPIHFHLMGVPQLIRVPKIIGFQNGVLNANLASPSVLDTPFKGKIFIIGWDDNAKKWDQSNSRLSVCPDGSWTKRSMNNFWSPWKGMTQWSRSSYLLFLCKLLATNEVEHTPNINYT